MQALPVIVLGAKNVGKTSLLSAAINGDFPTTYVESTRVEKYLDVERGLWLVDTPGVDDAILQMRSFDKFKNDPYIEEILGTTSKEKEIFANFDVASAVAYVIVYSSSSTPSRYMAEALHEVIRDCPLTSELPIFLVENKGDLRPSLDLEQFWNEAYSQQKKEALKNLDQQQQQNAKFEFKIFSNRALKKIDVSNSSNSKRLSVCVQTFDKLDELMSLIHETVGEGTTTKSKSRIEQRECDRNNCLVQ